MEHISYAKSLAVVHKDRGLLDKNRQREKKLFWPVFIKLPTFFAYDLKTFFEEFRHCLLLKIWQHFCGVVAKLKKISTFVCFKLFYHIFTFSICLIFIEYCLEGYSVFNVHFAFHEYYCWLEN